MPVCEVCDEEVETVTRCKRCEILFCSQCGSVKDRLCILCQDELEDEEEIEEDEEE